MSRIGVWLLGGFSLVSIAGYSSCPCDGLEGVESIRKVYLTLALQNYYETGVLNFGDTQAVAAISGSTSQNVLEVFWNSAGSFNQKQTLCTGSCSHLKVASGAPCIGWRSGTQVRTACFQQNSWTTAQVPGEYANLSLSGNTAALWGAFYNPPAGNYDFKRFNYGGSWEPAFSYKATGVHWDRQFGSIEASLLATDTDLYFSADEIFTGQLNYRLNRLSFSGDVQWSRHLYRGSQPTGTNPYFGSAILEDGENVYGAHFFPAGPNSPGVSAYSVDKTSGALNYSRVVQQYGMSFAKVPSLNLFLTGESNGGTVVNAIVPTPDQRFNWTRLYANGNSSTSQLRKQWDQSPWAGVSKLSPQRYLAAGSFGMQGSEPQLQPEVDNQVTAATLTVEFLTLGSFLNFAQFADGGGLSSQFILSNTGAGEETVTVHLRDSGGADLGFNLANDQITVPGTQGSGSFEIAIPAYGVRSFRTDGGGAVIVGSARVEAPSSISGVIAFGGAFGLAGVGNSSALFRGFTAPMETDAGAGLNTGIAVMNLTDTETTLEPELYADSGTLLSTALPINLPPRGQRALFVNEFQWQSPVSFARFRGLLKVNASGRTAATVLQSRPNQLATMPVAPL
jgi:hypothetical protein